MAYCGPRGIPHWHFLGGPAVWTDHDRHAALSWFIQDRRRCPSCGTDPEDWSEAKGGDRNAFVTEEAVCLGCQRFQTAQERMSKDPVKSKMKGLAVRLVPRPEEPPDADDRDRDG